MREFGCQNPDFIYCGDRTYPHCEREQWADGCNMLALREGVVLGYDRNEYTCRAFDNAGFPIVSAVQLLEDLVKVQSEGVQKMEQRLESNLRKNTLILLQSSELSRARGGSHCLTFPLERDALLIDSRGKGKP